MFSKRHLTVLSLLFLVCSRLPEETELRRIDFGVNSGTAPEIVDHPQSQEIAQGAMLLLQVSCRGAGLSFQ